MSVNRKRNRKLVADVVEDRGERCLTVSCPVQSRRDGWPHYARWRQCARSRPVLRHRDTPTLPATTATAALLVMTVPPGSKRSPTNLTRRNDNSRKCSETLSVIIRYSN